MSEVSDTLIDGAETFEEKSEDYGMSWKLIGEILLMLNEGEPLTLETKEDFVSFGLFTRRLDKVARAFNGEFRQDDLNFESVADSHMDSAVYAAMSAVNQRDRQSAESEEAGDEWSTGHPTTEVEMRDAAE